MRDGNADQGHRMSDESCNHSLQDGQAHDQPPEGATMIRFKPDESECTSLGQGGALTQQGAAAFTQLVDAGNRVDDIRETSDETGQEVRVERDHPLGPTR